MNLDPWLFGADAVDAETAACNEELRRATAEAPDVTTVPFPALRSERARGKSIFGAFHRSERGVDRTIDTPSGSLAVRQFTPEAEPRGVYLHMHGGGWVMGAPWEHDLRNLALAEEHQLAVVSVDYRLAPEHPYPAAPDDCEAAAVWLAAHGEAEFGSDRLAIGGESAGAHLAVTTLIRMRDRHGYTGFRAANLLYGIYDLAMTPSAANWGDAPLILSTRIIEHFQNAFVERSLTREPDVSPLYADLHSLPPALFTVGTLDPLLDDTLFMTQRWTAAGNRAELALYPGGVHAFDYFTELPLGRAAVDTMNTFVGSNI